MKRPFTDIAQITSLADGLSAKSKAAYCSEKDIYSKAQSADAVIIFADESIEFFAAAEFLTRLIPREKLYAVLIDHGLNVCCTKNEIVDFLKNIGYVNIITKDAASIIFRSKMPNSSGAPESVMSLYSPSSVRSFIKKLIFNETDRAAESLQIPPEKAIVVDFSNDTAKSEEICTLSQRNRLLNLKNNVPAEPAFITKAREDGRLLKFSENKSKVELRKSIKAIYSDIYPKYCNLSNSSYVSDLIHCGRSVKRTDPKMNLEASELVRDYGITTEIPPISSIEADKDRKRIYKHPILLASRDISLKEAMRVCLLLQNRLKYVNRILFRIDDGILPEKTYNYGLPIRRKTVSVAQTANRILCRRLKNTEINSAAAVLFPLGEGPEKPGSVLIRLTAYDGTFNLRTAIPEVDFDPKILYETANEIKAHCPQIGMVFYEITGTFPKTINAL